MNQPYYTINTTILKRITGISEKIGELRALHLQKPPAELMLANRIQTIQSTLEIEGNTLSIEQHKGLFDNKIVRGPAKQILEAKNAIAVYSQLQRWNPYNFQSLLKAHAMMMNGLTERSGLLRARPLEIASGGKIRYVAPPGELVYTKLKDLLTYLKSGKDILLIRSCVFHYVFEFIHPFTDGNGRMGRLWQTLILMKHSPVFEYLPVETVIKERKSEYYGSLKASDRQSDSAPFIEFMLEVIDISIEKILHIRNIAQSGSDRIGLFYDYAADKWFSRKDFLWYFKNISTSTASRDLGGAVKNGLLEKRGDKSKTQYRYRNRIL